MAGLTSNPTIFEHAISQGSDYDAAIRAQAPDGRSPEDVFFAIALEDITAAADLFRAAHEHSAGVDGFISLEVSPALADDTAGTIAEAERTRSIGSPTRAIRHCPPGIDSTTS